MTGLSGIVGDLGGAVRDGEGGEISAGGPAQEIRNINRKPINPNKTTRDCFTLLFLTRRQF